MQTRNRARLAAAIFYLIAAFFFGSIVFILASIGGKEGLSYLLATENPAQPTAVYLLIAGAFSLAVSLLLFSPASLSKFQQLGLLVLAIIQMISGVFFASVSAVVTILPLWFLFRFYRGANA